MAALAVSVTMGVMRPVLDKLGILMSDEYKKLKGLQEEVSFLKHELSEMAALLEKMEKAEELDAQAKHWRKDILELSYDIEDHIDDFMDNVGEPGDKVGILQKASHYLRTFKDRRRLANDFKKMKSQVIEASERRKRYMLDQCISNTSLVVVDPRLSALYKESASLVGIESEREDLIKWLLDEEQQLKVMSIVGFGGLGKTTLANEVYREVGAQFNRKAFVSVSLKPDWIRLLNSILSQLEQQDEKASPHGCEMEIINNIRKCLQDKRYVIIVDDLWDIPAWNTISCAFPQNNQHSRVIITTRNEEVARACSSNHGYVHKMKPLNEQDSRKLFFNRIFGSEEKCLSYFQEVSCAILKKCGGLPLAIITVASILACQPIPLKEQWDDIKNSLAIKSPTKSILEDMIYILELSYKNLPNNLKPCFLYLGTYPEDYEISKVELVRRWVAEGFVSNNTLGRDVWEVAESYFNELANRNMIQPAYEDGNYIKVSHCRVHDMMLDLILRKCREDNFLSLVTDPWMMEEGQDKVSRRLTVNLNGVKDCSMAMVPTRQLSQVRSLNIFGGSNWIPRLQEFKSVRVLFLDINGDKGTLDLTVINRLSQLRFLKITNQRWSFCKPLLGQIRSLRHLETLELFYLSSNCCIPDIIDFPSLCHLVVKGHSGLPEGIGKVKWLRTLEGFCLPSSSLENIKGLGQLSNLTYLSINSDDSSCHAPSHGWMAAFISSLEKLSNLKCFIVEFDVFAVCVDCFDSWVSAPFCDLERLDVSVWMFSRVPRWMGDLHNLRELRLLVRQIGEEDVRVIGGLPSLVQLYLLIPGVPTGRIMIGGSTGFRLLKWFNFDCDGTSSLIFEAGAMPSLVKLRLNLSEERWDKGTPVGLQHLSSLKEIEVRMTVGSELVRDTFQKAADALPGRPACTMIQELLLRPVLLPLKSRAASTVHCIRRCSCLSEMAFGLCGLLLTGACGYHGYSGVGSEEVDADHGLPEAGADLG
ncbi:hypothetical protein EJB05_09953, partial [Eragrostis curvula]